jgi:hypothetical protein
MILRSGWGILIGMVGFVGIILARPGANAPMRDGQIGTTIRQLCLASALATNTGR